MPHGTTATFNQYVKYFFLLANQFGKKEAPTSEQCYQPLPFDTGRVLLDCLFPNSASAEQLPHFPPRRQSLEWGVCFHLLAYTTAKRDSTEHTPPPGTRSPHLCATWDWSRKGMAFAWYPDQIFLVREGCDSTGTELSSWSILPFHKALPNLCMIQASRTAHISDQIVHKVPAAAWKVTPAIKCWETFFFFKYEGYGPLCGVLQPPSLSGRFTVVLWRHGEELIGFVVTSRSCQELTSALVTDEDITVTGLEMAQLAS